jgi:DNA-binding MarR family transcriptional regulator
MTDNRKTPAGHPADTVLFAMREASALGILYSSAVARVLGISAGDLECLDFVATHQPVTAGALAGATGLTTGAITGVIDRLEKAGFVQRVRPNSDRRKVLVNTTEAFLEQVAPLFEPMQRLQGGVIERCSEAQLRQVASFMALSVEAARDALAELASRGAG